jgi:UDP-N-acetyl-2-amino-2-deoxyglucuronate dehydrogenase
MAVSDSVPERMEQIVRRYEQLSSISISSKVRKYVSYHDLLRDPHIDAVTISVPSGLHGQVALEALRHGKHVIVEKPLALSIEEAQAMLDLAEQTGKKLAVCHQKRFYPHLQQVQRMVREGGLGTLVYGGMAMFYNRNDSYYTSASWKGTWSLDGGMLMNQGIHNVDVLLWMLGEPRWLNGGLSRLLRPIETEDSAVAMMKFENGSLASLVATVCADSKSTREEITFVGDKGHVKLWGKTLEPVEWVVPGWEKPEVKTTDAYVQLYEDFFESIRDNRSPMVSGKDGLKAIETVLAIYKSAQIHETVLLPIGDFSTNRMNGTLF